MALEYTNSLVPIKTLDEAVKQKGLILFGLNDSKEPALLNPKVFTDIDYKGSGMTDGNFYPADYPLLVTRAQAATYFTSPNPGTTRYKGAQGARGLQGPKGNDTNLRGLQGIAGEDNKNIAQGVQGYQGYQGYRGPANYIQGPVGIQGIVGPDDDMTWDRLKRLFANLGLTISDSGRITHDRLVVQTTVSSKNGFRKSAPGMDIDWAEVNSLLTQNGYTLKSGKLNAYSIDLSKIGRARSFTQTHNEDVE